jgi:hypothetical protein
MDKTPREVELLYFIPNKRSEEFGKEPEQSFL